MGHSWGKKLLGAHLGQIQLDHSWGTVEAKNDLKHSLSKLNTLGAPLGHTWGTKLLGAHLGQIWEKITLSKLNTLGAQLGQKVTCGTLGAKND